MNNIMGALTSNATKNEVVKSRKEISLNKDASEDYELVRDKLKTLLENGSTSVEDMIEFARESEHPRAWEVLATMLKTTGDLASQLIELQKNRHELSNLNNEETSHKGGTTNNNVFIGTTADLLNNIMKQEKCIDVEADEI